MSTFKRFEVPLTESQMESVTLLADHIDGGINKAEVMRRGLELLCFQYNLPMPTRMPIRGTYKREKRQENDNN